jgi:protein involved in polysaccharide export with SLBB domain
MVRLVGRIALVFVLVGVAWTAASAQASPAAQTFVITGEVKAPGEKMWSPGMTVEQAIGLADGMTPKGKLGHIKRPVKDADGKILRYEEIKPLKNDTEIRAGDTLVIARKWFAN